MTTFTDAEAAVRAWVNTQTPDLVGPGHPLAKGAVLNRLTGARTVAYALLAQVGGGTAFGAENPDQRARISALIHADTKEAAALAAMAYADKVVALAKQGGRLVTVSGALVLLYADQDSITGPLWQPDLDEPRYMVDADFYLQAVS